MAEFIVYPAIDLRAGKVVRLMQGDLDRQTTYGDDPVAWARRWFMDGAEWLHLVNLDGAFEKTDATNLQAVMEILAMQQKDYPTRKIQFGGGLRSLESIDRILQAGAARVVLGTIAATQTELVTEAVRIFGCARLAVALDVRDRQVSIRGWVESLPLSPLDFALRLADAGVHTLIHTDISRDGTSTGTNLSEAVSISTETGVNVILSGGVATLVDIQAARRAGLAGVITGRALYEGAFTLLQALEE
jgi:phosphoribosylformimino-5-aminoimidazole carboxamide ribotide isomerase